MKNKFLKVAISGFLLTFGSVNAGIITYSGDLTDGSLNTSGGIDQYDLDDTSLWDVGNLWTVSVNAGDELIITARRLTDFDPYMSVWEGVEVDTTGFVGEYWDDGSNTDWIGSGDDELGPNVPPVISCCGDPQIVFTASSTALYTIGVYSLHGVEEVEHFYTIQVEGATGSVSSVPEPSTLALLALGIVGLASRRFKKQS